MSHTGIHPEPIEKHKIFDRRAFRYTAHIPERRAGRDMQDKDAVSDVRYPEKEFCLVPPVMRTFRKPGFSSIGPGNCVAAPNGANTTKNQTTD